MRKLMLELVRRRRWDTDCRRIFKCRNLSAHIALGSLSEHV
jgi:hypothetical protein